MQRSNKRLVQSWTFSLLVGFLFLGAYAPNPYKQKANRVYDRLKTALMYQLSDPVPELGYFERIESVAKYYTANNKIKVSLPLLTYIYQNWSQKDGDAMLALLLGHELGHYHASENCSEKKIISSTDPFKKINDSLIQRELAADYFGGFCLHLAEIERPRTYQSLFGLLDSITTNDGTYPTKYQRIGVKEIVQKRVLEMIHVFDMGNFLNMIQEYEPAFTCYEHVLQDFRSREIYNNAAVSAMQAAMDYSKPARFPFAYPFEIDAQSRLSKGVRKPKNQNVAKAQLFLEKAGRLLVQGKAYVGKYKSLDLNKACWHLMNGDASLAIAELNIIPDHYVELMEGAEPSYYQEALILGIAWALEGEYGKMRAQKIFNQIESICAGTNLADMARYNLLAIEGRRPKAIPEGKFKMLQLEGEIWNQCRENLFDDFALPIRYCAVRNSDALIWENKYFFQRPLKGQSILPNQFHIGSKLAAIDQQFGPAATYGLLRKNGSYRVYLESELIAIFDKNDQLSAWCYFNKKAF